MSAWHKEGLVPSTHIEFITARPPPLKDVFGTAGAAMAAHKIAIGKHSYDRESQDELSFKVPPGPRADAPWSPQAALRDAAEQANFTQLSFVVRTPNWS